MRFRFPLEARRRMRAREVCAGCPVAGPCLAYAVESEVEGIWAATSKAERRGMRRP